MMAQDWKKVAAKRLATIWQLKATDRALRDCLQQRIERELFIAFHQRCIGSAKDLAREIAQQVAKDL